MNRRQNRETAERTRERYERQDAAPRLQDEVRDLTRLTLQVSEREGDGGVGLPHYTRVIVVATAPALFEIPCTDQSCRDGGHDITYAVMQALREHATDFQGEDACAGTRGTGSCRRVLHFQMHAEYARSSADHARL